MALVTRTRFKRDLSSVKRECRPPCPWQDAGSTKWSELNPPAYDAGYSQPLTAGRILLLHKKRGYN